MESNEKYNPVPGNLEKLEQSVMATEEGRRAYAEAQEEFAIIDAMFEAVEKSGLSQEELARRMGTTQSSVSRMLRGRRSPSWKTATRLFRATGCSVKRIVLEKTAEQ
ncbi:helix-turn-helix domain-containing protein [Victivallis vadensis]|uniref:helix-turn-helix domain-containing protein n=1 Tax=Victivallis vadensis TaxID=172901 RepID=UPI003CFFA47B